MKFSFRWMIFLSFFVNFYHQKKLICVVLSIMTKKKQKKKWRDNFEKYKKDLENQKGNLTESLTNHRLIILSARETARETIFSHTKKTTRQNIRLLNINLSKIC